jgi:hypothetical protein
MVFKKLIFTIKDIFIKKTIQDLDINLINENHLIVLQEGYVMFRRTEGGPLEFQYNDTTFTTKVIPDDRKSSIVGLDSGTYHTITSVEGVFAETSNRSGKLYEIKIVRAIDRILDLNKVCKEQGIKNIYLEIYDTPDGRDSEKKEKELFKLYGKELREKRIHGVKYRSRRYPEADCFVFYDTLVDLNKHLSYKDITDRINFLPVNWL